VKQDVLKGATSQTIQIAIQDSTSASGAFKSGLAYNTASLSAYYLRPRSAAVAITLVTQTATGAFSSGGFVEIDAVNAPGLYRLDLPDAALATGVNGVVIVLKGASGMVQLPIEIQLVAYDPFDAVRLGLTALPNVVSGSAGALPTTGTGANQISLTTGNVSLATAPLTAVQTENAVWDAVATSHNTALTLGNKLNAAASATDPWGVALPGAYGAGTAGSIVGSNLDATVSSRASQTSATAIKAKTDLLPSAPAAVSDIPTASTIAAAVWAYVVEGAHTARDYMRLLASASFAKLSGAATTTVAIRDVGDTKDRIVATVDVDGNRTAITTLDAT
jgi:hypothetical protein